MINVGIIGFGTVGTGTARILLENSDILSQKTGFNINLKKIADKDIKRDRGIKIPRGILTKDAEDILNDPDIERPNPRNSQGKPSDPKNVCHRHECAGA